MKQLLLIVVGFALGWFLHGAKSIDSNVTYNENGVKTIIVSCEHEQDCLINVGQQCDIDGYHEPKIVHDNMKTTFKAECKQPKKISIFN